MPKFPVDAPKDRVIKALDRLGFRLIREREHIAMARENPDGTRTPLTMPNHNRLKGSTLRTLCTQACIRRNESLEELLNPKLVQTILRRSREAHQGKTRKLKNAD